MYLTNTSEITIFESCSDNGKTKMGAKKVNEPIGTLKIFIRSNLWYDSKIPLNVALQITIGTDAANI